jgi:predicted O-linked N-acetylglucosamine transferase (SPINDLY family)
MKRLKQAYAKLRVGRWSEAETLFLSEIKADPWNPDLHFGLGVALEQQGRKRGALKHFKQACRGRPERNDFRVLLARTHQELGELAEALSVWVDLAHSETHRLEAYARMADICLALGQPAEAERALRQVIQIRPEEDSAWLTLAQIQLAAGRDDEAAESLGILIGLRPDLHQVHNELGRIHLRAGRLESAEMCFRQALDVDPNYLLGLNNLASLLQRTKRTEEALELYEKAIQLPGGDLGAVQFNYAHCLSEHGRTEQARDRFAQLLEGEVEPRVLWSDLTAIRVVLDDAGQVEEEKARFQVGLDRLAAALDSLSEPPGSGFFDPVLPSFHLHYQADQMREIQTRYGALVHRAGQGLQAQIAVQSKPAGEKIRVGFISAHFRRHTVSKLFGGWMEHLDRARFEVKAYHLGPWVDLDSRALAKKVEFHHLPGLLDQTALRIARDGLDVLIYPEVGMDADVLRLASLRLAPLQCMAWGHPVTSGLPNIDLFLSSEAMEPEDAADSYTEELVQLPGLSVCLDRPPVLSDGLDRAGLGLPEERIVGLCCQTLSKYRPEHDWIWVELARRSPRLLLVFIAHPSSAVTRSFRERLDRAFGAAQMQIDAHIKLLPRLSEGAYRDLNGTADLFLDSLGWSGGITTVEAIHHGLPVVTTPGVTMRSCHAAAILCQVGLDSHVSTDPQAYVERAHQLISDAEFRSSVRGEIEAASHQLWGDQEPIGVHALVSYPRRWLTPSGSLYGVRVYLSASFVLLLSLACSRPAVQLPDSGKNTDTSTSGHTGLDSGDSGHTGDTGSPLDDGMIKGLFAPMLLDPELHEFDDPETLAAMGFNTVGLLQYILVSAEGVAMVGWTDEEITDRVHSFQDAGLEVSLGLGVGYSADGDPDSLFSATNYPSMGVEPQPVLDVMGEYLLSMVPLAQELDVLLLSVNETDLFFYETQDDGSLDFSVVSDWQQEMKVELEAAGWGDAEDELLLWKTGYSYIPFLEDGIYQSIDIDMSGYDGAGFSLSPDDKNWDEDLEIWAANYRNQVDRFVQAFAETVPDDTWPSVSEFGSWDVACGFWNEEMGPCEKYWTEEHVAMAYTLVYESIAAWNETEEPKYKGVFPMSSPILSGQFELSYSELVQEAIAEGMAGLD